MFKVHERKVREIIGGTIKKAVIGVFPVHLKEKRNFHSFWLET